MLFDKAGFAPDPNVQLYFEIVEEATAVEAEALKLKLFPNKHCTGVFAAHFAIGCAKTCTFKFAVSLHPLLSDKINRMDFCPTEEYVTVAFADVLCVVGLAVLGLLFTSKSQL